MSQNRRRNAPNRSNPRRRPASERDFWGNPDAADQPADDIRPADDPAAMVASLGPAPLPGEETAAEHYFAAVYDKAASLAVALAAASDLLDLGDEDADGPSAGS